MRLSYLPVLSLVLYNSCSGNSLNNRPDEGSKTENEKIIKRIGLTDLNEDCLYLIFDRLEFNDLMKMAEINPKFAFTISDIFRRKYSDYEIRIAKSQQIPLWKQTMFKSTSSKAEMSSKFISINDFKLAANLMKYFGNHVRKVNILNRLEYNFTSGSDWAMINRIVNEYGSESVTKLDIGVINEEIWSQLTLPFQNVEILNIEIQSDTDGMKLNQMFPNLRELRLYLNEEANYDIIDCELPHLQHLDVITGMCDYRKEQIIEFMKKNPQIRSVNAMHAGPEFLKYVHEYLPNLEEVAFHFKNDDAIEPLHFGPTVKHCVLDSESHSSLRKLSFSQLETLETWFTIPKLEVYVEFFKRHSNLSRFHLTGTNGLTLYLNELTADLPNLVEMTVDYYSGISIEHVIRFIETHPKLMKFQFPLTEIYEDDQKTLRDRFKQDWHINHLEYQAAFLFEKKTEL